LDGRVDTSLTLFTPGGIGIPFADEASPFREAVAENLERGSHFADFVGSMSAGDGYRQLTFPQAAHHLSELTQRPGQLNQEDAQHTADDEKECQAESDDDDALLRGFLRNAIGCKCNRQDPDLRIRPVLGD
jgi:hypothetical protein